MLSTELCRTMPVAATSSRRSLAASRSSNFTRLCSMRAEPSKRFARISRGRYSVIMAVLTYCPDRFWRFLFFGPQLEHPLEQFLPQLGDAHLGKAGNRDDIHLRIARVEFLEIHHRGVLVHLVRGDDAGLVEQRLVVELQLLQQL